MFPDLPVATIATAVQKHAGDHEAILEELLLAIDDEEDAIDASDATGRDADDENGAAARQKRLSDASNPFTGTPDDANEAEADADDDSTTALPMRRMRLMGLPSDDSSTDDMVRPK
jgi:hypothetical protein